MTLLVIYTGSFESSIFPCAYFTSSPHRQERLREAIRNPQTLDWRAAFTSSRVLASVLPGAVFWYCPVSKLSSFIVEIRDLHSWQFFDRASDILLAFPSAGTPCTGCSNTRKTPPSPAATAVRETRL
jgi:hypothetical protein